MDDIRSLAGLPARLRREEGGVVPGLSPSGYRVPSGEGEAGGAPEGMRLAVEGVEVLPGADPVELVGAAQLHLGRQKGRREGRQAAT